jgi:small conductance mechanosensitive channel
MDLNFSEVVARLQEFLVDAIVMIPLLLIAIIVFVLMLLLAGYVKNVVVRLVRASRRPESLALLLGRLARWTVIGLGTMLAALIVFPGFTAGELVQLLGLAGLALGVAFRNIFEDFLAGILILLTQPFRIGDQIVVGEYEGTIESIETRSTSIYTYDGRRLVIPNSKLLTNIIVVNTAYSARRIEHDVGIGYGDDIQLARQVILNTLDSLDAVLKEPRADALVVDLADHAVVIRIRWWITPPRRIDLLETRDMVLAKVRVALLENGIDLPFPTRQILFHDQTEATDGDRRLQREGWPPGAGEVPEPRRVVDALHAVARAQSSSPGRDES